jgi:uncharacterized membrane protein
MRTSKFWKIIGLLLLVFLAGGVTGGVGTYVFTKRALEAAFDFDRWPDRGVRMLDDRLTLTPEQKVRVRVIQEQLAQQMKEHFRDSMAESGRILLSGGAEIDAELTAEQRVIHAEMKRELREGFRQHFHIELPEDGDSREGPDL